MDEQRKIQENVQCEIFQVILDEAFDSYKAEIVYELQSNSPEEMDENLTKIKDWIQQWKIDNSNILNP